MYTSLQRRTCVSPRMDRKPRFAVVHTLLSLMVCLCLACATRHEAGARCPAIEMSAVESTQTDSTKTVTLNDTAKILVSRTPVVTTDDITGATSSQMDEEWELSFTVTDAAAKRVQEFTKQHVGTNLAILVDGKVYGTPPLITGAVTTNRYRIEGFNRADAEQLAAALSNGCHR